MDWRCSCYCLVLIAVSWEFVHSYDYYGDPEDACESPPEFENAYVVKDPVYFDAQYYNGTIVEYRCHPGYKPLNPSSMEWTCLNNAWEGEDVVCEAIPERKCSEPPEVDNAFIEYKHTSKKEFNSRTTIRYHCKPGMLLERGALKITCKDGEWTDGNFSCKLGSCKRLWDPAHGKRLDQNIHPGQSTAFRCDPGYDLKGRDRLLCRIDFEWMPRDPPTCEPKQCKPIQRFRHGSVFQESWDGKRDDFGSVVEYSCHKPYVLRGGQQTRRCNEEGVWSGKEPHCYLPKCPEIQRPLDNGMIEYSHRDRRVDSSAFFVCNEESDLFPENKFETMCQLMETWDMRESDMPTCFGRTLVPSVNHGGVYDYHQSNREISAGETIKHGRHVLVKCSKGFEGFRNGGYLDNTAQYVSMSKNGTWNPSLAVCRPERCDLSTYLENTAKVGINFLAATITGNKIFSDDEIIVTCKGHYELDINDGVKEVSRRCAYGKINIPNCIPKGCPEPDRKEHPHLNFRLGIDYLEKFRHGSKVSGYCSPKSTYEVFNNDTNNFIGEYETTCTYGKWSHLYGCVEKHCDLPRGSGELYNADTFENTTIQPEEPISSRTRVKMTCKRGYQLYVDNAKSKQPVFINRCYQGNWSSQIDCKARGCQRPKIQNENLVNSANMTNGDSVDITCKKGYQMTYKSNVVRQPFRIRCRLGVLKNSRNEIKTLPECQPRPCKLKMDRNTDLFVNTTLVKEEITLNHNTKISVRCKEHYELVDGDGHPTTRNTSTCWLGTWRGTFSCKRKICSVGRLATHMVSDKTTVYSGKKIKLHCEDGYEINKNGSRHEEIKLYCNGTTLDASTLNCIEKRCYLKMNNRTTFYVDSSLVEKEAEQDHNTNVTVQCNEDFELVDKKDHLSTRSIMTCSFGNWKDELHCRRKQCVVRTLPPNMKADNDRVQSGAKVRLYCNDDYEMYNNGKWQEDMELYCNGTTLTVPSVKCVEKRCRLDDDSNEVYNPDKKVFNSGTNVEVSCGPNYELYSSQRNQFVKTSVEVITCSKGKFNKHFICKEARCRTPDEWRPNGILKRGTRVAQGMYTRSSKRVNLSCKDGFYLSPNHTQVKCSMGSWTTEFPKCKQLEEKNVERNVSGIQTTTRHPNGTTLSTGKDSSPVTTVINSQPEDSESDEQAVKINDDAVAESTGCVLPAGYTAVADDFEEFQGGDKIPLSKIVNVNCIDSVYVTFDYVKCMENGEFNTTLLDCTGSADECPELSNGKVIVSTDNSYQLNCNGNYTLHPMECLLTKCKEKKFSGACGNAKCLGPCKIPSSIDAEDETPSPSFNETESSTLRHNAILTATCKEGYEPEVVTFTCSDGNFRSNVTGFQVKDGHLPQCREARCDGCGDHGKCIRNNNCVCYPGFIGEDCNTAECPKECEENGFSCKEPNICNCPPGRSGEFCDKVDCPEACTNNGGQCEAPNECTCPPERTGDMCEKVRSKKAKYRVNVKIKDELWAGTHEKVKLTVRGKQETFTRELKDDLDKFNSFDKGMKLRYDWKDEYDVGEIIDINFSLWPVGMDTLRLDYVSLHSFSDNTFYRFSQGLDGQWKISRRCSFETQKNAYFVFKDDRNRLKLAYTNSRAECQLVCAENPDCKQAWLDRRTANYKQAGSCVGSKLVYNVIVRNYETKYETYTPSCN